MVAWISLQIVQQGIQRPAGKIITVKRDQHRSQAISAERKKSSAPAVSTQISSNSQASSFRASRSLYIC